MGSATRSSAIAPCSAVMSTFTDDHPLWARFGSRGTNRSDRADPTNLCLPGRAEHLGGDHWSELLSEEIAYLLEATVFSHPDQSEDLRCGTLEHHGLCFLWRRTWTCWPPSVSRRGPGAGRSTW